MENQVIYNSLSVELKKLINLEICKELKINVKCFKLPKSIDFTSEIAKNGNIYKKLFVNYEFITNNQSDNTRYKQESKKLIILDPLTNKNIEIDLNESFFMFYDSDRTIQNFIYQLYDKRFKGNLYVMSSKGINNLKYSRYENSMIGLDITNPLDSDNFLDMLADSFVDNSTAKQLTENNTTIKNLDLKFRTFNPKGNIDITNDNILIDKENQLKIDSMINDLISNAIESLNIDLSKIPTK